MQSIDENELADIRDEVLLASSVEDPEVFAHIVRRYEDAFLRKVRKVVWVREDAEDIVQETFVRIYKNAGKFREVEGASFKSWAYTILMNTACTRYRKTTRERERRVDVAVEQYESLPDIMHEESFGREKPDYVYSVFSRMPEQLRKVLELYFIKGLPQQMIAEEEGVSVGAIKTRVHRAKAEFKRLAEQQPFV